jgi:hypothetical protein
VTDEFDPEDLAFVWSKQNSFFKNYRKENKEFYKKCFDFDYNYNKIIKFKNLTDL